MTNLARNDTRRIIEFQHSISAPRDKCILENGRYYLIFKEGAEFKAVEGYPLGVNSAHWSRLNTYEYFTVYYPIHPSVTLADADGATHAWDDGEYWHFAHASEDSHHEMALILEALTLAAFQPQIERAVLARFGATDAAAIASTTKKLEALYEFRNDVFKAATAAFYAEHMGHYHANRHAGHYRSLIKQSVESIKSIWTGHKTKKLLLPAITLILDSIESDLTPVYTVKTRAQKAAEAAKQAAATQTEGNKDASS